MPADATPGTWRPNAADFGAFATAIAPRYDGRYPDPADPGTLLPRVADWQGWNEPNPDAHLAPQWIRHRRALDAISPGIYRGLENAFYSAVKKLERSTFVVMAGTAPYSTETCPGANGCHRSSAAANRARLTGRGPGRACRRLAVFYRSLFRLRGRVALRPTPASRLTSTRSTTIRMGWRSAATCVQRRRRSDPRHLQDHPGPACHAAERDGRALPHGPKAV
jgi:hypothetical protein